MFRDRDEELRRLQAQLLEEEEEQLPEEEDFSVDIEEENEIPASGVYQNFSNGYGRDLRNYASGYKAYNSDRTDTDLDSYSDTVREGTKRSATAWFVILLLVLMGVVVGVILWKYLGLEGLL